jgi:hypothetical protein
MKLGEAVALSMLRDLKATYSEFSDGFSLTRFDGSPATV